MKTQNQIPKKRSYYRSTSFVTALLYALFLGAAVVFLAFYLFVSSRNYFIETTESSVDVLVAGMSVIHKVAPVGVSTKVLEQLALLDGAVHYRLFTEENEVISTNFVMPDNLATIVEGMVLIDVPSYAGNTDMVKVAARVYSLGSGLYLLLGRDITRTLEKQNRLEQVIWVSMVALLMLIVLSFTISRMIVGRINQIAMTARSVIATGDLSKRISVSRSWDDLSFLAAVLNQLFQRMEELVEGMRQVSNNIAHDLRTPVAHLRHRIEDLQRNEPQTAQQRQQSYEDLLNTADNLLSTFSSLLRIAAIENTKRREQFAVFNLQTLIEDVTELYLPLAEDRGQEFTSACLDIPMYGDRALVFQMLANLLDNAIKYAPAQTQIRLWVERDKEYLHISISDQGSGIPAELRDKVLERFFRVDSSRGTKGNGLGLSLVAAVVKLHEGTIRMLDNQPGLVVVLSFSLTHEAPPK